MVQLAQRAYSVGEYFGVEQMSDLKHEYYAGSIYVMAGASVNHNRIAGNILTTLSTALRGSTCEVFGSKLRIATPAELYTYPDVSVICNGIQYGDTPLQTVTNPVVLFEVLSDATRQYDRGDKFDFYRAISTLRDYVLIEQAEVHVEHRTRTATGEWTSLILTNVEDELQLPSLNFRMLLRDIYERVEFIS